MRRWRKRRSGEEDLVVLSPIFELTVGKYKANGIKRATVEMTRKNPADICEVEFPNHRELTLDVLKEDDPVDLSFGFAEFEVARVFLGTVKEINPNLPLKIKCESIAGAARKNAYKETYENATWKTIAEDALSRGGMTPQMSPDAPPTKPPKKFRVNGHTPAQVLNTIAEETGWVWYAIPGTEDGYFGPPGEEPPNAPARVYKFTVGKNVYADDCDIEYVKERKIKKVVVTLTDSEGKVAPVTGEFKAPDYKEGAAEEKLKFAVYGPSQDAANARAEEEYIGLSTPGFKGSFVAVGNPYVHQGSLIALAVPKYDDKVRRVTVENVRHKFGDGLYKMRVEVAGGYE